MENTLLSTLVRQVSSAIGWLGGGLVGITAILSALGYLVIRSHQDLLGIMGFVPIPPETWSLEGARFVYNSLLYLVGGFFTFGWVFSLVLASIGLSILSARWPAKIQNITNHVLIKTLLVIFSFLALSVTMSIFLAYSDVSHLLTEPLDYADVFPAYDDALAARSDNAGIQNLRLKYAVLESMLLFLFVWLKVFLQVPVKRHAAKEDAEKKLPASPWSFHWYQALWFLFLILLLLLPMNYGKMVKSNQFFKVRLIGQLKAPNQSTTVQAPSFYEGWLLHKDAKEIVFYTRTPAAQQFHIFERDQFVHIQTVAFGNIFSE